MTDTTDEAIAKADPDTEVRLPEAPWEPGVVHHWPVRRILLHLLQETAQHAGHADIIRESLDGASTTARRGQDDPVDRPLDLNCT